MTADRILAAIGIVLALPGFFLLFFTEQETVAAVCVLLAAVICAAAVLLRYFTNLPPFKVKLLESSVTIYDRDGKRAEVKRTYTARSNFRQQNVMSHKNIGADGSVVNICWDGKPVLKEHIRERMHEWEVDIHFDLPLQQWAEFKGTLSYEVIDSFPRSREGVVYGVEHATSRAMLRVTLPNDRPCKTATAVKMTGAGEDPIGGLVVSENNTKLELEVKRPRQGSRYAIYWTW